MLIDLHVHLYDEPGYGDALAETARNLGIDRMCIGGGESRYGLAPNAEARRLADVYPDLFVPFARIVLGQDGPNEIERYRRAGFLGLRVCAPPAPYDDEAFFPVYEVAQALRMPVAFHTAFLPTTALDHAHSLRVDHMRPVHLDTIARSFPGLPMLGVALGRPWYEEAAEVMRYHANVFFDLAGDLFRVKGTDVLADLLRSSQGSLWEDRVSGHLVGQLVFGSGARCEELASVERDYRRLFRTMGLAPDDVDRVMGGNAARVLGIATQEITKLEV